MAGEPDRDARGTRGAAYRNRPSRLERTPLGPTRGNLIGEKKMDVQKILKIIK